MRKRYTTQSASQKNNSPEVYGGSNRSRMEKFRAGHRAANKMEVPAILSRIYSPSPFVLPDETENYPEGKGMVERIYVPIEEQKKAVIDAEAVKPRTTIEKFQSWLTYGVWK